MTLDDFSFLAIEGYLQIKIWDMNSSQYIFEGEICDLDEDICPSDTEICSWELGTTEDGEAYLGLNVEVEE